ncbi:O-antigen ligase family protein [Staphylospora marina]|uniref:O-antigen ligase family protein n=1 Tax=Staphylospora marina TaxID=2490858 RepID=UPI000F5BA6B9|nr:O-antigen ligase family protein [Staphylospora marina]
MNPANHRRLTWPDSLFLLLVFSAVMGPMLGVSLTDNFRLTLFRIAFVAVSGWIFVQAVRGNRFLLPETEPVRKATWLFAGWFAWSVLSLTWAADTAAAVRYTVFLGMMLGYALCFVLFVRSTRRLKHAAAVLLVATGCLVFYGFFESITRYHLPVSRYRDTAAPAVTSFFTNQNDFATALTLALPFLITALCLLRPGRLLRWFLYVLLVLSLYGILATASRINTFFVLPVVVFAWLATLRRVLEPETIRRHLVRGTVTALLIVLAAGTLSGTLLHQGGRDKLASVLGIFLDLSSGPMDLDELDAGVQEGEGTGGRSITVRKYLLLYGFRFLHQSGYFGVGAGNVEHYMQGQKGIDKTNIHNWWAEVLVNYGVVVFVFWMIFYASLWIRLWRLASLRRSPDTPPLVRWAALSCVLSLTGYVFGGMAPSTAIHFTPMWTVIGLGLAVLALGGRGEPIRTGDPR